MAAELTRNEAEVGPFHVHRGHAFEGFELRGDTPVADHAALEWRLPTTFDT